jgi:hypothetical protein
MRTQQRRQTRQIAHFAKVVLIRQRVSEQIIDQTQTVLDNDAALVSALVANDGEQLFKATANEKI